MDNTYNVTSTPVRQSTMTATSRGITPYCEGIAFLKCPQCRNCIPLTVEERATMMESNYTIPNLSPILRRLRGDDIQNDISRNGILLPPEINRVGRQELLEPETNNPRESTPVPNLQQKVIMNSDQMGTSIMNTSDSSTNDPFRLGRVNNSPVVELRRNPNPIAGLPCVPSSGNGQRSVFSVGSQGFETDLDTTDLEDSRVALNSSDTLEQRWTQCHEDFKRDIIGLLIPRLEQIKNLILTLADDHAPRR